MENLEVPSTDFDKHYKICCKSVLFYSLIIIYRN